MAATFTIDRAPLLAALTVLARIPDKRNTIPILTNILIEVASDGLRLTTTDLDIQVTQRVAAEVAGVGTFTVRADQLADLVKRLPPTARITIEDAIAPGSASLRAGRSRYTLRTLPAADFPNMQEAAEFGHAIEIPAGRLASSFATVSFAISTEETRYYLNGTYLHVVQTDAGHALRFVATDGHRLARVDTLEATDLDPAMPGVIVPTKAQAELRRLCEADPKATFTLEVNRSQIRATAGDTVFVCKLIDGTFPDYERVTPRSFSGTVQVVVKEATDAIERVVVLSTEKGRRAVFRPSDGRMEIEVRNDEGEGLEEIEVSCEGAPPQAIGFNGRYLTEILTGLGTDTALIKLGDAASAAVIVAAEDAAALFVLMPMRS